MTNHEITAHFDIKSDAEVGEAAKVPASVVIDHMANALLGGRLGLNNTRDIVARSEASKVYVMVMAMLEALS